MITRIENIPLDPDNLAFTQAYEFVKHTDRLVYLTGKAGTGKTTFLKFVRQAIQKNTVILAPTGVAAINAGGVTIHSFFQLPFGPFLPNDPRLRASRPGAKNKNDIRATFRYSEEKKRLLENLELLIIDEVSMVRCDTLDIIDKVLRHYREKPYQPFGGVQVILIGDTFQLPPVVNQEQWSILSQFYKTPFFFSAAVIEENKPVYIELKKIYRQNEQAFIDLLNRVRVNQALKDDFALLNAKYAPGFSGEGRDYIILATHNQIVNETNLGRLEQLPTRLFTFEATVTGEFPDQLMPTDPLLKLKAGAQIMFIKNDMGEEKRYYNGKIGRISELNAKEITVVFDDGSAVKAEKFTWENIRYAYNPEKGRIEQEIIGTFEQFPLKLAWAITVHKSQGLTFEKVIADLGRAFAPGQVYVALSRCTSLDGLVLKTQLHSSAIKTDPQVLKFAQTETPDTLVVEQLNTGKADFYYKKAREAFHGGAFSESLAHLLLALKFRNDLETDTFMRYFVVQAQRLFRFRENFALLSRRMAKKEKELLKAQRIIESLAARARQQQESIEHQQAQHRQLTGAVASAEKSKAELIRKNKEQAAQLAKSKKETERLKKDIAALQAALTREQAALQTCREENEKLKNRKWYRQILSGE